MYICVYFYVNVMFVRMYLCVCMCVCVCVCVDVDVVSVCNDVGIYPTSQPRVG